MADLRARDLRNDLSSVLRRVQAGERLRVTLRGRPVAVLEPIAVRPPTIEWGAFWSPLARSSADPGLTSDLEAALPGSTDDLSVA